MRRLNRLRSVVERLAASPNSAAIDPAELRKLLAEDGAEGDRFGDSVALSADGSTALIGDDFLAGEHPVRAYVFVKGVDDTFSQQVNSIPKTAARWRSIFPPLRCITTTPTFGTPSLEQLRRHVEGRSYFGWFVPTKKGAWD